MSPGEAEDSARLKEWLALFGGEGFRGFVARDAAVAEMRAAGAARLFPLLLPMLDDPRAEVRCAACQAVLWIDLVAGPGPVLRTLGDPDPVVRWNTCGLLHDFADERALPPLVERLASDPDVEVRANAAYALGGIRTPRAIPALIRALDGDHAETVLGHSPSSCAATALDEILGTEVLAVHAHPPPEPKFGPAWAEQRALSREAAAGFRALNPHPRGVSTDYTWLRERARQAYCQWAGRQSLE